MAITINKAVSVKKTTTSVITATSFDIVEVTENKDSKMVLVIGNLSDGSTTVNKMWEITGTNYTLLNSSNPSWANGKPANEYRKEDLWWMITYIAAGSPALWVASTVYAVDDVVYYGKNVYTCTTAGTSGTTAPTATASTTTDGTVTWTFKLTLGD